jgi:hypothetical protein
MVLEKNATPAEDETPPNTHVSNLGKDTARIGCRTMLPTQNPEANRRTASESRMREIRPSGSLRKRSGPGRNPSPHSTKSHP